MAFAARVKLTEPGEYIPITGNDPVYIRDSVDRVAAALSQPWRGISRRGSREK